MSAGIPCYNTRMPPKTIKVIVTSDQPIYLRGLSVLLMALPDIQLAGQAATPAETLQLAHLVAPDLILLDLRADQTLAMETIRQLHRLSPRMHFAMMVDASAKSPPADETSGLPLCYLNRDIGEEEFKTVIQQIMESLKTGGRRQSVSRRSAARAAPAMPRSDEALTRELVMAGKVQADIMPAEPPVIPGWEIAATLNPARETSGDFYDFIPLTDRKWGIMVADVSDKGMGAALIMALSSSLIRTYASRFPTLPAVTMSSVNERILSDTRGSMFLTAFFGILEPHSGRLVYVNAGHPPGFLINLRRGRESIERLKPTGMAMGISEKVHWSQKIARINPGDFLILYTDGITETQNAKDEFFGEERLLEVVLAQQGRSAEQIRDDLLAEINRFAAGAPRSDDIAVIVIRRLFEA